MDGIVSSIEKWFISNSKIYADFYCWSPYNNKEIKNCLPDTALNDLASKLILFNKDVTADQLKTELLHFATNWEMLKKYISDTYTQYLYVENENKNENNLNKYEKYTTYLTSKNCAVCIANEI